LIGSRFCVGRPTAFPWTVLHRQLSTVGSGKLFDTISVFSPIFYSTFARVDCTLRVTCLVWVDRGTAMTSDKLECCYTLSKRPMPLMHRISSYLKRLLLYLQPCLEPSGSWPRVSVALRILGWSAHFVENSERFAAFGADMWSLHPCLLIIQSCFANLM